MQDARLGGQLLGRLAPERVTIEEDGFPDRTGDITRWKASLVRALTGIEPSSSYGNTSPLTLTFAFAGGRTERVRVTANAYTYRGTTYARPGIIGIVGYYGFVRGYPLGPELMTRLRSWQQVLDDVDEFSRRGDLLAPTISAPLARLRTWALLEFVRQSAGAPPTPWPGPSAG